MAKVGLSGPSSFHDGRSILIGVIKVILPSGLLRLCITSNRTARMPVGGRLARRSPRSWNRCYTCIGEFPFFIHFPPRLNPFFLPPPFLVSHSRYVASSRRCPGSYSRQRFSPPARRNAKYLMGRNPSGDGRSCKSARYPKILRPVAMPACYFQRARGVVSCFHEDRFPARSSGIVSLNYCAPLARRILLSRVVRLTIAESQPKCYIWGHVSSSLADRCPRDCLP